MTLDPDEPLDPRAEEAITAIADAETLLMKASRLVQVPSNIGPLNGTWTMILGGMVDVLDGVQDAIRTFGLEPAEHLGPESEMPVETQPEPGE